MKKSVSLATIKELAALASRIDKKYSDIAIAIDKSIKIMVKAIGRNVAQYFVDTYWEGYKNRHGITESVLTSEYKEALKECLQKFVAEKRFSDEEISELMYDLDHSEGFLSTADKDIWPKSISTTPAPGQIIEQKNVDKGLVDIHYTNHKGQNKVFQGYIKTLRRKINRRSGQPKAHISVQLCPSSKTVSLAVYRIKNWAQIEAYV